MNQKVTYPIGIRHCMETGTFCQFEIDRHHEHPVPVAIVRRPDGRMMRVPACEVMFPTPEDIRDTYERESL